MQATLALLALLSNLVLVGITAWYAWQTHRTVLEMQESRRAAVRPHVHLDLDTFGNHVLTKVENVGNGPALNVKAALTYVTVGGQTDGLFEWSTPVLRPGESRLLDFPVKPDGSTLSFKELRDARATLALGGSCESVAGDTLELDDVVGFLDSTRKEVTVSSSTDISSRLKKIADELSGIRRALP